MFVRIWCGVTQTAQRDFFRIQIAKKDYSENSAGYDAVPIAIAPRGRMMMLLEELRPT
jgi:hypothetical protein